MARKVMVYSLTEAGRAEASNKITSLENEGWSVKKMEPTKMGNIIITMERGE